jgi:hypothetical protein
MVAIEETAVIPSEARNLYSVSASTPLQYAVICGPAVYLAVPAGAAL